MSPANFKDGGDRPRMVLLVAGGANGHPPGMVGTGFASPEPEPQKRCVRCLNPRGTTPGCPMCAVAQLFPGKFETI